MTMQVDPKVLQLVGRSCFALPAATQATAGACTIVTEVAISDLVAGACTVAAQPDYPRNLRGILTDANATITSATLTIFGQDQNGVPISDVLTFSAAGSQYTVKAFSKVTSVTWALVSGTVTTTSDTIALGYGTKLGLIAAPNAVYDRLIKAEFNGADDAGTFSATYGLYTPAGTLDGAKPLEIMFLYKLLMNW